MKKIRCQFYFEDDVTELPLINYISDYFVEVDDAIRGKIVRLMEDTGLEHEELQRGMNQVADELSKLVKDRHYSLQEVSTLIQQIEKIVDEYTKQVFPYSARLKLSKLISISDTIAIFTPKICHAKTVVILELHARIAKFVLEECVKQSYPIRGAIAVGQYNTKDNIMIGPGIDECASWHETCNWIGVHLTPSAEFAIKNNSSEDIKNIIIRKNIPVKNGYPKVTYCVKWYVERNEFENLTNHVQALLPEISGKHINTYEFLYDLAKRYNVSADAIMYRLVKMGKLDSGFYNQNRIGDFRHSDSSGGNFYNTRISYLGNAYLNKVFSSYYAGNISKAQVGIYTNLRSANVSKLASKMFGGAF